MNYFEPNVVIVDDKLDEIQGIITYYQKMVLDVNIIMQIYQTGMIIRKTKCQMLHFCF